MLRYNMLLITGLILIAGIQLFIVFIGWVFNVHFLKAYSNIYIPMMPNTAITFFLLLIVLIFFNLKKIKIPQKINFILLSIISLVSLFTLLQYIFNINSFFDVFLLPDNTNYLYASKGRMSPFTSIAFILCSISTAMLITGKHIKYPFVYVFSMGMTLILSFINVVGFLADVNYSIGFVTFTPMAFTTSLMFILMTAIIGASNPTNIIIPLNVKKQIFYWLIPIIVLFGLIFSLPFININEQVRHMEQIELTLKVQNKLFALNGYIIDFQKATLGYLISDQYEYVNIYENALNNINNIIPRIEYLIRDNPSQIKKMDNLKKLINDRILFSENIHELLDSNNKNKAVEIIKSRVGTNLVAQIKSEILLMIQNEEKLLKIREYKVIESNNNTKFLLIVALISTVGLIIFFFSIIKQDINERERIEEELKILNETLTNQAQLTNEANKELESFSYTVSHDLRAPLRHIAGFVELLKKSLGTIDDKSNRYINIIIESSTKMGNLIEELLAFSKINRSQINKSEINSNEIINELITNFKIDKKLINGNVKVSDLPIVKADQILLRQVWWNLLSNAIKYSRNSEPQKIFVSFKTEKDYYVFSVNDNGVGFDMQYYNKLFGVFHRLHDESEFEGTGIGLANVKKIINRHGGEVWAESELGKGSTFYFSLPVN